MSKFFKALQQAEQERALRPPPVVGIPRVEAGNGHADEEAIPAVTIPAAVATPAAGPIPSVEATPAVEAIPAVEERPAPELPVHGIAGVEEHLVSVLRPSSFEAGRYRTLSHFVERLHEAGALTVLGLASPAAGDGKTVTAINLAGALAQDARSRVLLLEADMRRPALARYLGLPEPERGLTHMIANPRLTLAQVVTSLPEVHFDLLAAGHQSATPYEVLRSPRAEEIFREARRTYDYVVVDTSPLVAVPEALVIEKLVDGLLIVVRAHHTPRGLLEEGLRLTDPAKVLGLVFNGDDHMTPGLNRYRYAGRGSFRNGHGNH
jgi:capsular exopolysaccharide synthesis family protein